jgi:hypothetical protein
VARSTNRDMHSSDAKAGVLAAAASGRAGAALKPRKPAGSKHDRNLSATNSEVATRPAHVESKSKKGTKERKRDLRQARSPTSGNGRSEVDCGVKEIVTANSSLKPRKRAGGKHPRNLAAANSDVATRDVVREDPARRHGESKTNHKERRRDHSPTKQHGDKERGKERTAKQPSTGRAIAPPVEGPQTSSNGQTESGGGQSVRVPDVLYLPDVAGAPERAIEPPVEGSQASSNGQTESGARQSVRVPDLLYLPDVARAQWQLWARLIIGYQRAWMDLIHHR